MSRQKSVTEHGQSTLAALQALTYPEQLAAAFFNASTVGLAVCDDQLRYQVVNETLAAMNGFPAEAHLGKTVREILGSAAYVFERRLKRVLATGRPAVNIEVSLKLPTRVDVGHWIGSLFPIQDRSGRTEQIGVIVVEVTEQRKLEQSLRTLTRKLLRAQDKEQRRIARHLHDSINQYHAALKMNLLKLRRVGLETAKQQELLAQSIELVDHCMAEARTISHLLHPPLLDEMGFISATRWYAKGFSQRSGIQVSLHLPADMDRLPAAIETALFRILQEALTNVHRHAQASAVRITVQRTAGEVILEIQDNGSGMSAETLRQVQENGGGAGVGLASMYERVHELKGWLQVECNLGTTLRATIPAGDSLSQDLPEEIVSAASA